MADLRSNKEFAILLWYLLSQINMHLACPECKNDVDLSSYTNLAKDQVIECAMCGITLLVTDIQGGEVTAEVTDEGK